MRQNKHTDKTKKIILDLYKKGFSTREVAEQANKMCKNDILYTLSRNSCIAIKHRAGMCIPNNRKYDYPKRKDNYYDKSLAFNEHKPYISLKERSKRRLKIALEKYDV